MAKKGRAAGPVVGLDIGSRWIKAVEVRPGRGGPTITGIGYEPTPEGAVVEEAILDSAAVAAAIKRLFQAGGITVKSIVSSVSGQSSVVVRIIEVPKMTDKELAETMKWEVERHIPFPSSEIVMDFKPLGRPSPDPDDQTMEVLLAVCQEDIVNKHMEALSAAKLTPSAIEVEAVAVPRALLHNHPELAGYKTVAVADIGSGSTKMAIYENGILVFPRNVPIAGINFVSAVAQAAGLDEEEAERKLRDEGAVDLDAIQRLTQPPEPAEDETQMGADSPFAGYDSPFIPQEAPELGQEDEEPDVPPAAGFDLGDDFVSAQPEGTLSEEDDEDIPSAAPGGVFDLDEEADAQSAPSAYDLTADEDAGPVLDLTADEETPSAYDLGGGGEAPQPPKSMFDLDEEPLEDTFEPVYDLSEPLVPLAVDAGADAGDTMPAIPAGGSVLGDAIAPVLVDLAAEIRRSLEYYASRNPEPVEVLILSGGIAKLPGIAGYLESETGVPVRVGDPLEHITLKSKRYSPEFLHELAPIFTTSLGLALRDYVEGEG